MQKTPGSTGPKNKGRFPATMFRDSGDWLHKISLHPVPTAVTLTQAAEMLGISRNTARKLNLRRNGAGLIPYEAVLDARSAR